MQLTRWLSFSTIGAVVIWGAVPTATKFALRGFDPLGLVILRLILTSLIFFIWLVLSEKDWRVRRQDLPLLCLAGILGAGTFQVLFAVGVNFTTASNTGVIMALSPIFTALVSAAIGQEGLRPLTLLGILISFGGVFLLVEGKGLGIPAVGVTGDLIIVGAAFAWSIYQIAAAPLLKRYSVLKVTTYATVLAGAVILPFTVGLLIQQDWSSISLESWGGGFYFIFFGGLVALWLWGRGLRRLGPTQTMVYYYFQPLVGVAAAIIFLAEQLNLLQFSGIGAIFLGVGLARKW